MDYLGAGRIEEEKMEQQELKLHGVRREIARADQQTGEDRMERVPDLKLDVTCDDFVDNYPENALVQLWRAEALMLSEDKKRMRLRIKKMLRLERDMGLLGYARQTAA